MYEYFDFNYENAIFEWDDEKAAAKFCLLYVRLKKKI